MNVHKNARLAPRGREILISRLKRGERLRDVATAMGSLSLTLGIGAGAVYKWRRRYREEVSEIISACCETAAIVAFALVPGRYVRTFARAKHVR